MHLLSFELRWELLPVSHIAPRNNSEHRDQKQEGNITGTRQACADDGSQSCVMIADTTNDVRNEKFSVQFQLFFPVFSDGYGRSTQAVKSTPVSVGQNPSFLQSLHLFPQKCEVINEQTLQPLNHILMIPLKRKIRLCICVHMVNVETCAQHSDLKSNTNIGRSSVQISLWSSVDSLGQTKID